MENKLSDRLRLIQALQDQDVDVRNHGAEALVEIRKGAVPDLIEALQD